LGGRESIVAVDTGEIVSALLVCRQARGRHAAELGERCDPGHVHRTPDAGRLPRGEPDAVRLFTQASTDAVDPAEAERLVDRFGPGDARSSGAFLVIADQELRGRLMVGLEPRAEIGGGGEERRFAWRSR